MSNNAAHVRTGFRTVTPYLIVQGAPGLIDFMRQVFDATEIRRDLHSDGSIMNAEMRIGDSIVELAEAGGDGPAMPCGLHVYVPDTDATYQRALQAGASSLYAPADMPYGERSAGVRDASGNSWYIATFQEQAAEQD